MNTRVRFLALILAAALLAACAAQPPRTPPEVEGFQRSLTVHCSPTQEMEGPPCLAKARQACDTQVRLKNVRSREEVRLPVGPGSTPQSVLYKYAVGYYCLD